MITVEAEKAGARGAVRRLLLSSGRLFESQLHPPREPLWPNVDGLSKGVFGQTRLTTPPLGQTPHWLLPSFFLLLLPTKGGQTGEAYKSTAAAPTDWKLH